MDWEDLKVFAAVAEHGTVRRAADALGVHHATVGRRVERLERDLDARLFDRRPEGHTLTAAGEDMARVVADFSPALRAAARQIGGRDTAIRGRVVITMAEPIAVLGLAPRLADFEAQHPELELAVEISMGFADISRGAADVAIRMDNNPPETLVGKRLFPYHETIYASPEYAARIGGDPAAARWIGWGIDATDRPQWVLGTGYEAAPVLRGFRNLAMQVAATRQGLGLGMLPCFIADRDPALVRVGQAPPRPARDIWLLTHPDLRRTARIRAVMIFAEAMLRADRMHFVGSD